MRCLITMGSEICDWTEDLPQTEHVRFFKETNWTPCGLGPPQQWGPALRLYTHQVMADTRAATIYW